MINLPSAIGNQAFTQLVLQRQPATQRRSAAKDKKGFQSSLVDPDFKFYQPWSDAVYSGSRTMTWGLRRSPVPTVELKISARNKARLISIVFYRFQGHKPEDVRWWIASTATPGFAPVTPDLNQMLETTYRFHSIDEGRGLRDLAKRVEADAHAYAR